MSDATETMDRDEKQHTRLVNIWQTPEERRQKYWLLRSFNVGVDQARRKRDWRLSKIERFLGIEPSNYKKRKKHDKQLKILCSVSPS